MATIGIGGFLSGMALANINTYVLLVHPFIIMLKPAFVMRSYPDMKAILFSLIESLSFLAVYLWLAQNKKYE